MAFSGRVQWCGGSTATPRSFLPPDEPCCCNWLIPGWPRRSPSIRTVYPTLSAGFTAPSASSLRWCSVRPTRRLPPPRRLFHRHTAISGALSEGGGIFPGGSAYCANDVAALRWVFATLVDSAIVAFELVNPALSSEERERYYREERLFAAFFGIPQTALPQTWPAFSDYVEQMVSSDMLAGRRRGAPDRRVAFRRFRNLAAFAQLVSRADREPAA